MIELQNLTRTFGDTTIVDQVSLVVPKGEIAAVVGTSGAGKTTVLRMVNRLIEPTSGRVLIDGQDNRSLPAHELRRQIGYVIQGHGLFPHRTVAQNIATVPQLLGWAKARTARRVEELLDLFQLDPAIFHDRMPHELSGGQRQRVGVARALAAEPSVLLMDEPFGALDPIIRAKAQDDLLAIQRRFGTTILLVTHDMDEAIHLGTWIAAMDQGRLLQYAPPAEIIANPATDFVAALIGTVDKPFRLLSLIKVEAVMEEGTAEGPALAGDANLRDALAESLWSGRDAIPVERDGRVVGQVTRAALLRHAARPR